MRGPHRLQSTRQSPTAARDSTLCPRDRPCLQEGEEDRAGNLRNEEKREKVLSFFHRPNELGELQAKHKQATNKTLIHQEVAAEGLVELRNDRKGESSRRSANATDDTSIRTEGKLKCFERSSQV